MKEITLRQQETKVKSYQIFNGETPINYGLRVGGPGDRGLLAQNILGGTKFSMTQGPSQQQRVGNSISHCRLSIRGYVFSLPVNNQSNFSTYPFLVKILLYKVKNDPTGSPNEMLQYPDNTNGPMTGDTSTLLLPYNKKTYSLKKVINLRMKANPIAATSTQTNVVGIENPSWNGSYDQANRFFKCSVPIKDVLMFDDSGTQPNNEWVAMGVSVFNGDGSTIVSGPDQRRCRVTAYATLRYKDA